MGQRVGAKGPTRIISKGKGGGGRGGWPDQPTNSPQPEEHPARGGVSAQYPTRRCVELAPRALWVPLVRLRIQGNKAGESPHASMGGG